MREFNWENFKNTKNKIAVHCKTEDEAKDFCKQMNEHGMTWRDGKSYINETYYRKYTKQTCYYSDGGYSSLGFAEDFKYTVLEWSDYMQKEFTKDDLKDGMVVEQRDGCRLLVIADRVVDELGYNNLEAYGNDLKYIHIKNVFDIIKVFRIKNRSVKSLAKIFEDSCLDLIWERKETKKMTVEEMRQKLEELTGESIDVISN